MKYKVLAITGKSERLTYCAINKKAACEMAMSRNRSPYAILYIVVEPNGNRITISNQRKYLNLLNTVTV